MKPKKNKIFCIGCRKTKILFESQSKANNFISFNKQAIYGENRKAPVRSYYCVFCCGWHTTSNQSKERGENMDIVDKEMINQIMKYTDRKQERIKRVLELNDKIVKLSGMFNMGYVEQATELLGQCYEDLIIFRNTHKGWVGKYTKAIEALDYKRSLLIKAIELIDAGQEAQDKLILIKNPSIEENALIGMIGNRRAISKIKEMIEKADVFIFDKKFKDAYHEIKHCRKMLSLLHGEGRKYTKSLLKQALDNRMKLITPHYTVSKKKKVDNRSQIFANSMKTEDYKKNILSLICRIEAIQKAYNEEDYDICETLVEVGYMILEDLGIDDENIAIIKSQLDKWSDKLRSEIIR